MNDLAENLQTISTSRRSVSELCRQLGFNRQQFARYLTGETRPSKFNLRRIADGLGIPVDDLLGPHDEFTSRFIAQQTEAKPWPLLERAFPGEIGKLRPLLGYYHGHFEIPYSSGMIVRSLIHLHERDGKVISKAIERRSGTGDAAGYLSKYHGMASYLGHCIFVVEFEYLSGDSIVETVLYPPYRKKLNLLSGLTFGVTSQIHRRPFASGVVWKFLGRSIKPRDAIRRCGQFALNDRSLDPSVRRFFVTGGAGKLTSVSP